VLFSSVVRQMPG